MINQQLTLAEQTEIIREALLEKTSNRNQPQTFIGERGDTLLSSGNGMLTYKDAYHAFLAGINRAAGMPDDTDPYVIVLDEIDIVAAAQNMCCILEQRAGIYPNVPETVIIHD